MSIAITDDHRALAETASSFLAKREARAEARALLEAPEEGRPALWDELVSLGWLGLHLPEEYGGSGYGLEELVILVEETGRTVTPGPFLPTVIASAVLDAAADDELKGAAAPGARRRLGRRRGRARRDRSPSPTAPPRGRPGSCSAAAWHSCS